MAVLKGLYFLLVTQSYSAVTDDGSERLDCVRMGRGWGANLVNVGNFLRKFLCDYISNHAQNKCGRRSGLSSSVESSQEGINTAKNASVEMAVAIAAASSTGSAGGGRERASVYLWK